MKNPFNRPLVLKNTIQEYAWGSKTAIQNLLETPPTGRPWAELWLGAHPKAPSQVDFMGEWVSLDALIDQYADPILGKHVAEKFNNTLPYLFKILAADQPLSIQAHPSVRFAREGFQRENALKIPLNAESRNYKDVRHKPECICALTPFWALKGFRDADAIARLMGLLCPSGLAAELADLRSNGDHGLKLFFNILLTLPEERKLRLISEVIRNSCAHKDESDIFSWVLKLHGKYPSDIGIVSPALLNLIRLDPGQALFLSSGELHSYLGGVGIELMSNSDNVIRCGLTPKHVDVEELLRILNFTPTSSHVLIPQASILGEETFPLEADEFSLSRIIVSESIKYISPDKRSAEILLCINGSAQIHFDGGRSRFCLEKGGSVLIPAAMNSYGISGDAAIYKAGTPL
ncbi:MAG: mannose-6-phosphate isomerase, class I [Desulfobacterales bacterium]|jgi:mannose-6-phosphate isomerase|nr:mannose-6-phosphate isomerase, class I [Desulfobacterales bacterium]